MTFTVTSPQARLRGADGIFYEITRTYQCATAEEAEALYRAEIETNAPPVVQEVAQ